MKILHATKKAADRTLTPEITPLNGDTAKKELISAEEAARFLGLKKSYLYKLTSTKQIPFYKYGGRVVVFDLIELQEWRATRLQYIPTQEEQENRAVEYCTKNPLK